VTHYIDALRKRSASLLNRAETVSEHFQNISLTIKKEFELFEGAVQGILPPNLITKILQWSSVHMQRALRDPITASSASILFSKESLGVGGGGSVNSVTTGTAATLSTSHHQKLSLSKPSPSLSEQMIPKHQQSSHAEMASKLNSSQFSKSLPPVKPDPFNRYFTSSDSLTNPNSASGVKKK
jgi:hypothetical protein